MVAFESTGDDDLMGVQRDLVDDFLAWLGIYKRELEAADEVWDLDDPDDRQALINEWAKARHSR